MLPLAQRLSTELKHLGRVDWAREEFARLNAAATICTEDTTEKWRKLRGIGSLDRLRLALVRDLFQWREDQAAQSNRPPRTLLRDDLLIEIARSNPRRERDLTQIRGLPRRHLPLILEVMERTRVENTIHEINEETYWYFLEVLPPKWFNGNLFAFAEGQEPLRLHWRHRDERYFCRQLTDEQTNQFCDAVGLSKSYGIL